MKRLTQLLAVIILMVFSTSVAFSQLSGTYTVGGTSANYPDIKAAFDDANLNGIGGDVTFQIVESHTLAATAQLNEFDAMYSVTISPDGTARTIDGTIEGALLRFEQADNINILGEISGERGLIFKNNYSGSNPNACLWFSSADNTTDGCENIVIDYCELSCTNEADNDTRVISATKDLIDQSTGSVHGNFTITNNYIYEGHYGIYLRGVGTSQPMGDIVCNNNTFSNTSTDGELYYYATYFYYTGNVEFNNNQGENNGYGLYSYYAQGDVTANNNNFTGLKYRGVAVYYAEGYATIQNNNIYDTDYGVYVSDMKGGAIISDNQVGMHDYYGIYVNWSDYGEDIIVENNRIYESIYTYQIRSNYSDDVTIRNNVIENCTDLSSFYGIYVYYADDNKIYDNVIRNIHTTSSYAYATYFSSSANVEFYNNVIEDISSTSYAFGMYITGSSTSGKFHHNTISKILTNGNTSSSDYYGAHGVRFNGGNDVDFYHNTINLYGSYNGSGTQHNSCVVFASSSPTNIDMRNNIFRNAIQSGSTNYAVILYNDGHFSNMDYNAFDLTDAPNPVFAKEYGGSDIGDIAAFRTYIGSGDNVTDKPVQFISDTDLHLDGAPATALYLECPQITDFDTDIDGETRLTNTMMGIDEVNIQGTGEITTAIEQYEAMFCPGDDVTFNFAATVTGPAADEQYGEETPMFMRTLAPEAIYTWYRYDAEADDYVVITGEELIDPDDEESGNKYTVMGGQLTIHDFQPADVVEYYATAEFHGETVTSEMSTPTIATPSDITMDPVAYNVSCERASDILLEVAGTGHFEGYQWEKYNEEAEEWVAIEGATDYMYLVDVTVKADAEGRYRARLTNSYCEPIRDISEEAVVFMYMPVENQMASVDAETPMKLCTGDNLLFTAEATGDVVAYQWQYSKDNENWSNLNTNRYPSAATAYLALEGISLSSTGFYRCEIMGESYCMPQTVYTDGVEISVGERSEIVEQPVDQVICKGDDFLLDFIAAGGEVISFQWMKDGMPIDPEENETAIKQQFFVEGAGHTASGIYSCQVTVDDCRGIQMLTTDGVLVYVLTEPEIKHQPVSQYVAAGGTAIFEVKAHVHHIGEELERFTYQWYKGDRNTPLEDNENFAGTDASIMSITNLDPMYYGDDYFVVVTGQCGETESVKFSIDEPQGITIGSQPAALEICENEDASFEVAINITGGLTVTYEWYKDGVLIDATDTRFTGFDTEKLDITGVTPADAGAYHVKVVANNGVELESNPADLTVNVLPIIDVEPVDVTVKDTEEFTLTVESANTDSYQWYKDGAEITDATDAEFKKAADINADAGQYYCVLTNACGTTQSATVTVDVTTVTSINDGTNTDTKFVGVTPNPVSSNAEVTFATKEATNVTIALTDVNGTAIATVFDEMSISGNNVFTINVNELNLVSGTYYLTMTANGFNQTIQLVIVK